jgi:hypothetical protein
MKRTEMGIHMRKLLISLTLIGWIISAGCSPRFFQTAILATAIVGTAVVLAHHDAHFHNEYCGHPRRWHDGHWIYYYNHHWEYYDPYYERWYYYEEY